MIRMAQGEALRRPAAAWIYTLARRAVGSAWPALDGGVAYLPGPDAPWVVCVRWRGGPGKRAMRRVLRDAGVGDVTLIRTMAPEERLSFAGILKQIGWA